MIPTKKQLNGWFNKLKKEEIMYNRKMDSPTYLYGEELVEGETIENKVDRMLSNKEPIKDGAPLLYTERKDGVKPGYNIRTDRFEVAAEAMDLVNRSRIAKRDEVIKPDPDAKIIEMNNVGGAEPTPGKGQKADLK